jgi:hypothetical protein
MYTGAVPFLIKNPQIVIDFNFFGALNLSVIHWERTLVILTSW